ELFGVESLLAIAIKTRVRDGHVVELRASRRVLVGVPAILRVVVEVAVADGNLGRTRGRAQLEAGRVEAECRIIDAETDVARAAEVDAVCRIPRADHAVQSCVAAHSDAGAEARHTQVLDHDARS